MISPERIARVMDDLGLDRMQAINHLRQRDALRDRPRPYDPTFTLNRQIASARKSMGEERWNELNAEWE